jgi:hypothetical protein
MLARRFTIICLLMTLFGMYFATLVVDLGRNGRPREIAGALPLLFAKRISADR